MRAEIGGKKAIKEGAHVFSTPKCEMRPFNRWKNIPKSAPINILIPIFPLVWIKAAGVAINTIIQISNGYTIFFQKRSLCGFTS